MPARVLITDAGRGSAIAIIRSLGRRGVHVVAADHDPRSPGFRSRFAAGRVRYPDPARSPAAAVDALCRAAVAESIDLIVPVSDEVVLPLAAARERFDGVCALAIPSPAALASVTDKHATLELARRLGIPAPRSVLVRSAAEALAAAPALGWPVVVKPVASRRHAGGAVRRFTVGYADGPAALAREAAATTAQEPALLQEYRAGEGHGVEIVGRDGVVLAAFQHRRLHEVPITGGASALRESVPLDPVLLAHTERLVAALDWTGLAMVEFRVGPGGPVLMEVNGRVWGSLPLAVKSGVDFPAHLAALHLDGAFGPPPAVRPARIGVRSRNIGLELTWIGSVLRRGRRYPFLPTPPRRAAVRAGLRLAWPRDGFDVLCREDPRPALAGAAHVAAHLARKALRER
jgi:predicted ATP-grasp superfamily ATP-dependent carboligase